MIVKIKDGTYRVDVRPGGDEMQTLLFAPGPWYARNRPPTVDFRTVPEGWWGIDCNDFLKMALIVIGALIRDKYWGIKRWVKGNA